MNKIREEVNISHCTKKIKFSGKDIFSKCKQNSELPSEAPINCFPGKKYIKPIRVVAKIEAEPL